MNRHEELLDVSIHAALAHLVGLDLDECVVPAFSTHTQLRQAERAGEGASPRLGFDLREAYAWKERIGSGEDLRRRSMAAIEVPHSLFVRQTDYSRRRRRTLIHHLLHPFDLLERMERVATEAHPNRPQAHCRVVELSVI